MHYDMKCSDELMYSSTLLNLALNKREWSIQPSPFTPSPEKETPVYTG